jgi:hypothetical protein
MSGNATMRKAAGKGSTRKPKQSPIDELLEVYGAPTGPVEALMPNGKIFKFRVPATFGEAKALEDATAKFVQDIRSGEILKGAPQEFVDNIPKDDVSLEAAFRISQLSLEPKISQLEAFKLMRAPKVVRGVMEMLNAHEMAASSAVATEYIEKAKKDLGATPYSEPV